MCMIDGGDKAEMWSESTQRARKTHKCGECGREIQRGELYWKVFGVHEGYPFSGKWCAHCNVAKSWLWKNCGGSVLEGVIEDCLEHVQDYRGREFTPALARVCAGARRKWTKKRGPNRGQLMPVPALPGPIDIHETH